MQSQNSNHFGPFRLDTVNECLWRGKQAVALKPKAFAVLRYLVEHPGRLVSKNELLDAVWLDAVVSEGVLKFCVREIRKALGDNARSPRFIETLHRRGYRFIAAISTTAPPSLESRVQRLALEDQDQPSFPVPTLDPRRQTLDIPLVGREAELAQLHHWFDKALSGERQIVFVTGEPGIGKTTLIEVFLQSLESSVQRLASESQKPLLSQVRTLDPRPQTLDARPWLGRGQCIEHYGAR